MKKNIHQNYNLIIFQDILSKYKFINIGKLKFKEKIFLNKKNFFFKKIEISSKSHKNFTKNKKNINTYGRSEKFKKKYSINY